MVASAIGLISRVIGIDAEITDDEYLPTTQSLGFFSVVRVEDVLAQFQRNGISIPMSQTLLADVRMLHRDEAACRWQNNA